MTATPRAVELVETAALAAADKLADGIIAYDVSDQLGPQRGEQPRGPLGLRLPGLVERDVRLPLEAALGVPDGLAVPPQDQPYRIAQGFLP